MKHSRIQKQVIKIVAEHAPTAAGIIIALPRQYGSTTILKELCPLMPHVLFVDDAHRNRKRRTAIDAYDAIAKRASGRCPIVIVAQGTREDEDLRGVIVLTRNADGTMAGVIHNVHQLDPILQ